MVCSKCEKKLSKGVHGSAGTKNGGDPKSWGPRGGASNNYGPSRGRDDRKIGENMILKNLKKENSTHGEQPYGYKCKTCKKTLQGNFIYCTACAFKDGRCAMCGKRQIDTSEMKMSLNPK